MLLFRARTQWVPLSALTVFVGRQEVHPACKVFGLLLETIRLELSLHDL